VITSITHYDTYCIHMVFKDVIASSVGASIAEIITLPICTIKTNYQTNLHYKGIFDCTKDIYSKHGILIFYNSSISAISSQMVSTASKYAFYEFMKKQRRTQNDDFKNNVLNGIVSGVFSSIFVHPFDFVKVHSQQNKNIYCEYQKNGMLVFYRGYTKNAMKSVSSTMLLFPVYDFYKQKLESMNINYIIPLSATLTTITVTSILHPIDYLKNRHISGLSLYENWNPLTYYRGMHLNLMRAMPHFATTMILTEKIKRQM